MHSIESANQITLTDNDMNITTQLMIADHDASLAGIERWLPVVGYENFYQVSNLGRVKSSHTRHTRRSSLFMRLTPRKSKSGRTELLAVRLSNNGTATTHLVHTLVLEAFVGIKDELVTRHLDSDATNNLLCNLLWGTTPENVKDKIDAGNQPHGTSHGRAKLTEKQVIEIRTLHSTGAKRSDLANQFDMSWHAINGIVKGTYWKHLQVKL